METLVIGKSEDGQEIQIQPKMANRHGLVAGATGTGKTVTLQVLAERFSRLGVPVFAADVKGDLSGISSPAQITPKLKERLDKAGITNFQPRACPVLFWDVYGKAGHQLRATISEMGPLLLARILNLNETQSQVLEVIFKIADDQGLLLLDSKDLKELLSWVSSNLNQLKDDYGNIAPATVATIQRAVLTLSEAGAEQFLGEPALNLQYLMQKDFSGNGVVSLLDATRLLMDTRLYSTFLLWLLSELFETMPEVGDLDKPKLVFFFDEAHLLFKEAPSSLVSRIEQVVRLIRSKGVGIYFVTQNPADIPESVLAQLGNRFQHALRAYTPSEQKAVKVAAQSFRPNPKIDTERAISELEVGQALVSVLDAQGKPSMVERVSIYAPESQIGIITEEQRKEIFSRSPIAGVYDQAVDRESAYESIRKRKQEHAAAVNQPAASSSSGGVAVGAAAAGAGLLGAIFGGTSRRQGLGEALVKSVVRSAGSSLGRQIIRGVLGSMGRSLGGR